MINRGTTLVSRLAMLFAVLFALAACGGGGGGGGTFFDEEDDNPVTPPVTSSYSLALTLHDSTGSATTSLPQSAEGTLKVVVTENDANALPVPGALVSVQVSSGSVNPTSGITDENGLLTLQITAGATIGAADVTATTSINSETFTGVLNYQVVEYVPYLLQLTLLGPDEQPTSELTKDTQGTLQAKVISADGSATPVAGILVNTSASIGSIVPSNGQLLTNSNGIASFTVVAGSTIGAGAFTSTAQIGDLTLNTELNFQVTGETQTVSYFLELTLLDADGKITNSVAKDKQGTLQAKVTSGSVGGSPVSGVIVAGSTDIGTLAPINGRLLTDVDGIAAFPISAGSVIGAGTLSATVEIGDVTLNRTLNFQVADGTIGIVPYFVELTLLGPDGQPTSALANNTQGTLQARVSTESGSPVSSVIVNAATTFGDLLPGNGESLTNASGIASFTVVAGADTGAGVLAGTVEIGGNTFNDSLNFEVIEGDLYFVQLTLLGPDGQPTSALANNTQGTLQARITSESGDPVSNVIVNTTTTFGSLLPGSGQVLTDASGIATFTVLAGANTGAGVLTSSVQIGGNSFNTTLNFEVIDGELHFVQLTLLGPDGQPTNQLTEDTQGTLQARITSESGDPIANVIVNGTTTFGSLVPGNGQSLTDANGIATFRVEAGAASGAGVLTGTVQIGGNTFTNTLNFKVVGDELYFVTLTLLDSEGQTTTAITERTEGSLQILVTRDSESGPPVAGVIVTAAAQLGTLEPTNGLTNSLGIVTLKYSAGLIIGAGTVIASTEIAGDTFTGTLNFEIAKRIRKLGYYLDPLDPDSFIEGSIKIIPDPVTTILSAGGSAQLSVAIVDENDQPIKEQEEVIFTSGCIAAAQSTINPTNPVSVFAQASTLYSAVSCSGTDEITASIAGTDAQATGTLRIAAPDTNSINFISAEPTLIVLRGTGGEGRDETSDVVFQVMDQSGRPLPGVSVELGLSTRVGELSLSTDVGSANGFAISNGDGEITVTVQAGNVATVVRVLASVDDGDGNLVTTVSDLITVTTGIPDQNSISLSVSEFVVPNASNRDGVTATLTVRMADRFNNPVVEGTAAVFTTEYGMIEGSCTTDVSGACSVIWTSAEPRIPLRGTGDIRTIKNTACPDFIGANFVPCPSDLGFTRGRRSTILVHAIGEESFVDSNGNGQMDSNEFFENISEAFNDHNEDTLYTPLEVCDTDPDSAQCKAGIEETFVDFNSNGLFDPADHPPIRFNGLSCPVEGDGDWCSRTLLNVWDSVVITLSDDTSWAVVMVRGNMVESRTVSGALQTIYISDQYNNPPPAGSTVTLSATGNCEIVGETSYVVPALQSQGAFGLPVRTKRLDTPPTNPEFGTFSVNFNPAQGVPVRWVYECDTPAAP